MTDSVDLHPGYRRAMLDWLACVVAGRGEPAVRAAAATDDPVLALAAAGHVLDFDDTYGPGLAHLSAPTAPAALVTGGSVGATVGEVLEAFAAGFEAMAALARASHPELYERGWHPTAVTGTVGAAVAAARLLGLDAAADRAARRLAVLGAAGLQAAFGSDGKALQVGAAASAGVRAAQLAGCGATVGDRVEDAFARVYGGTWCEPDGEPAIVANWIKAFPCCLQTHSSIEAAARVAAAGADPEGEGWVTVHPRSRQAAPLDDVTTGLEAKFSIPYTVAFTVLHGPPGVADFAAVDPGARRLAASIRVETDADLSESAARLDWRGSHDPIRADVTAARGSPARPMTDAEHSAKVRGLAGDLLSGVLDDPARQAAAVLELVAP